MTWVSKHMQTIKQPLSILLPDSGNTTFSNIWCTWGIVCSISPAPECIFSCDASAPWSAVLTGSEAASTDVWLDCESLWAVFSWALLVRLCFSSSLSTGVVSPWTGEISSVCGLGSAVTGVTIGVFVFWTLSTRPSSSSPTKMATIG